MKPRTKEQKVDAIMADLREKGFSFPLARAIALVIVSPVGQQAYENVGVDGIKELINYAETIDKA